VPSHQRKTAEPDGMMSHGIHRDRRRVMAMVVSVVATGSFTAAARDLHSGQPADSKAIVGIEDRSGVRLLVRSPRRRSPTEAGIACDERALRAITEANEAEAATEGAGTGRRLRMCAPVTLARLPVGPKLGAFLEAHPKLRGELVRDDRPIDVVAEHLAAALVARQLTQGARFVVASPAYLARAEASRVRQRSCRRTPRSSRTTALAARHGVLRTRSEGDV
jgi:DNA-binding transcriptional LysR family regulator